MPTLETWVFSLLAVGLRVAGLLSFAPFLGSASIPARIRAGLAAALTAVLVPVVRLQPVPLTPSRLVLLVVHETVVGALLGLVVQFVFDGVELAGQMAGLQMGFSLETLIDPQTLADTPVLAVLFQLAAVLIFLALDVHLWVLRAVVDSFHLLPPEPVLLSRAAAGELLRLSAGLWVIGVEMAAPVLLATLAADVVLSFLTRLSPQLSALFLGLAVKNLLGYAVLVATVGLWPAVLERAFARSLAAAVHLLRIAG
jgi:flagellar biosynthetic protein FliR